MTQESKCNSCGGRGWVESGLAGREAVDCPTCKEQPSNTGEWLESQFCKDHLEDESWIQHGCPVCAAGRENQDAIDAQNALLAYKDSLLKKIRKYQSIFEPGQLEYHAAEALITTIRSSDPTTEYKI